MRAPADPVLVRRLSVFASAASVFPIAIGLSVLAGWALGFVDVLTWGLGTPMAPNTAGCIVLAGVSLWLRRKHDQRPTRAGRAAAQTMAAIVAVVGSLSLEEHLLRLNFGIDRLLLITPLPPQLAGAPVLMSPISAGYFLLLGLALLLIDWKTRRDDWPAQFLCLGSALAPAFGLLGLILGPRVTDITVALPSVLCYFLLASGLICARATWALGGLLSSQGAGARLLRRAVPAALTVLSVIGWFVSKALLTDAHFTWVEVSLLAVSCSAALTGFIAWMASIVERSDAQRRKIEEAFAERKEELDRVLNRVDEPEAEAGLRRKVEAGFIVAVFLTVLFGVLSWHASKLAAEDADWVARTHQVMTTLEATLRHLVDVETGGRGFALTGDEPFLKPYESGEVAVGDDLQALHLLLADNPTQQRQLQLLEEQANARIAAAWSLVEMRERERRPPAEAELEPGKLLMDAARTTVERMESEEKRLLGERSRRTHAAQHLTGSAIVLGSVLGAIFLSAAGFTVSREIGISARARAHVSALNAELEQRVAQRTAALGDSEGRLAGVIQSAMDAIITVDEQQNIVMFNAAAEKMFRCPVKEALGQAITRFIPQRFHAAHAGHVHKFADTGVTSRAMGSKAALWAARADGQEFQIEASISQVVTGGKKLFTVILRDVTERVQAEQAVREAQDRMTGIIASAMDSIITTDDQQRILVFNAAAEKMFRCSAGDALGQPVTRFIPQRFHAAHGGHIRKFGESGATARAMGALGKLWAVRADGEEFQIEASISHIETAGKKLFTVILRDITERVQAGKVREHLAAVVDSSDDAIISKDLNGIINAWNHGAEKVFGYSAAEAVGKPMLMLFPPERVKEEADILARIARGESVEHFETVRIRKGGERIDVSVTISPIRDSNGTIVGASKIAHDITERKRDEKALREQAQVLDLAQVLVRDMSGHILLWNLGAENLYGFSKQEAVGKVSHELLQTEFPQPVSEIEGKLRQSGTWEGELVHRKRDGSRIVVSSLWVLHRDEQGSPLRILEANVDITARKHAEQGMAEQAEEVSRQAEELLRSQQALENQKVMLQSVLDSISEGLVAADETGKFLLWNPAATRIVGMGAENVPPGEWNSHYGVYLPDTVTPFPPEQNPLLRAIRGEACVAEMYLHNQEHDSGVWIEASANPLESKDGVARGGVIAFRNITERKKADQRLAAQAEELAEQAEDLRRSEQALQAQARMLQSVLDTMKEGLIVCDRAGNFVIANPAVHTIFGRQPMDVPIYLRPHVYDLQVPDGSAIFPTEDLPLVRALRGETTEVVALVRNPVAGELLVEASGWPLRDEEGAVWGGMVTFRDITQAKAAEREIRKLNNELEQRVLERTAQLETANRELEAFTYSVSHDLRAPLRHIGGFSRILIEDFGPELAPEAREHAQRIEDGVQRMGMLVDELLNLARVGRHALRLQSADLNSIVEEVISLLQPEIAGRVVTWRIASLSSAPCDPVLIKQVFQNLIANALKFTRPREVADIEISCRPENGNLIFAVRDNGVGFNMKYMDKLFGVFQRLHRAEDFEGTGIGLATVQRIIHKHGGRVWAEAEVGKGATFFFTLRAAQPTSVKPGAVGAENSMQVALNGIDGKIAVAGVQA
jgi:PAS domain S-box-containing protein